MSDPHTDLRPGDCILVEKAGHRWDIVRLDEDGNQVAGRRDVPSLIEAQVLARSDMSGGQVWISRLSATEDLEPWT